LYAACGIIFIGSEQVQTWWKNPAAWLKFRLFDATDGAQPALSEFLPRSSVASAFYETRWFAAFCIAVGVAALWLLYLIRVRQIEMRIRMRLEEGVIERERIARDLHDTFLQSVQGLVLRFQAVLARIPEGGERPVRMMEQALERADQVIAEGRDRVYDLRKSTPVRPHEPV
jgi:signal transduction histidine kinase